MNFDAYHHLVSLTQQGWNISYVNYTAVNGIDLPSKIILEHSALRVVIVITAWQT